MKTKHKKDLTYVLVKLTSYTEDTSTKDPTDKWSRPNTFTRWTIGDTFKIAQNQFGAIPIDFNPVEEKPYYMIYYIWSTGDSFGHDECGQCEVHMIFEDKKDATKEKDKLLREKGYSVPWNGHFESLQELEIKEVFFRK